MKYDAAPVERNEKVITSLSIHCARLAKIPTITIEIRYERISCAIQLKCN